MSLIVHSITFEPNGAVITYQDHPADVRVQGKVTLGHQVVVSADHPDYAEDIDLLQRQAVRLLANVLEDFNESEPYQPGEEEDDEDRGMGMR